MARKPTVLKPGRLVSFTTNDNRKHIGYIFTATEDKFSYFIVASGERDEDQPELDDNYSRPVPMYLIQAEHIDRVIC